MYVSSTSNGSRIPSSDGVHLKNIAYRHFNQIQGAIVSVVTNITNVSKFKFSSNYSVRVLLIKTGHSTCVILRCHSQSLE